MKELLGIKNKIAGTLRKKKSVGGQNWANIPASKTQKRPKFQKRTIKLPDPRGLISNW